VSGGGTKTPGKIKGNVPQREKAIDKSKPKMGVGRLTEKNEIVNPDEAREIAIVKEKDETGHKPKKNRGRVTMGGGRETESTQPKKKES